MKNYFLPVIISANLLFLLIFFITGKYPFFIILLHFVSLIFLFLYSANVKQLWIFLKKNKTDLIITALLFAMAFIIRVYNIDVVTPGLQGDELILPSLGLQLLKSSSYLPYFFVSGGHGTLLPYLAGISITLFGKSIFALRFPSILFGTFSIVAFYILLRLIFKKSTAFLGSLLFVFSYAHIALSRLAFETAESIFFQIVTGIFLYLSVKTKDLRFYIGVGLALAIGNYTYLDFRIFTIIIFAILLLLSLTGKLPLRQKLFPFLITVIVFIACAAPLLHYSITHTQEVAARPSMMSIFNQGLTNYQILHHLLANIQKVIYVFIPPGDPNGRVNPGNTSMFDYITTGFFLVGLGFLFRKQKVMFFVLLFMFLIPVVSDIFAKESGPATGGPNAFNGFGHPNTMRIEGFIPLVLLGASFGVDFVYNKLQRVNLGIFMYGLIAFSAFINYSNYFNQQPNGYTESVNGVNELFVTNYINNNLMGKKVYMSPDLINGNFLQFFIKDKKSLLLFNPNSLDQAISIIATSDATFIDKSTDGPILNGLYQYRGDKLSGYSAQIHTFDSVYFEDFIYIKNQIE